LCYNHEDFVVATLNSVNNQSYKNIELIIIDDCSQDSSVEKIRTWIATVQQKIAEQNIRFIALSENIGNCKAFNMALKLAKGKYVIDLATDDILLPQCIEKQVLQFEQLTENYAVVFANAIYIDKNSNTLHKHHKTNEIVADGDIYAKIVAHSFICTPTMMMRKTVLDALQGYDESLSYEDFDFWIRSSRNYLYSYIDEIIVQKRILKQSLGTQFYTKNAYKHLESTLRVCHKIAILNRNSLENKALAHRIRYHIRLCCYTNNYSLVSDYHNLLQKVTEIKILDKICDKIWILIAILKLPLHSFYSIYKTLKFKIF
jgi:glycosyltransferase involved in cell wall biosynthesis